MLRVQIWRTLPPLLALSNTICSFNNRSYELDEKLRCTERAVRVLCMMLFFIVNSCPKHFSIFFCSLFCVCIAAKFETATVFALGQLCLCNPSLSLPLPVWLAWQLRLPNVENQSDPLGARLVEQLKAKLFHDGSEGIGWGHWLPPGAFISRKKTKNCLSIKWF